MTANGDENVLKQDEAIKRFYDLAWPQRAAVLRVAQILTHDLHEAEDLAQETLVKAFKAIAQFKPGTDARKWLLSILRNTRIDRLRAAVKSANDVSLDQFPADFAEDRSAYVDEVSWEHPQEILNQFSDEAVIQALQELPEEIRWSLLLADVEGLKIDETAAVLDVPTGTVKSRLHRGRGMLRQTLMAFARDRRLVPEA